MRVTIGVLLASAWVMGCSAARPVGGTQQVEAPRTQEEAATTRRELWVDGAAPAGGDGSRQAPHRSLQSALEQGAGATIHLATGLYRGPFVLPRDVRLVGGHAVVLHAEAGAAVVTAQGPADLVELIVQGGDVGLQATGEGAVVTLTRVRLSGQRKRALQFDGATLNAEDLDADGTISETVALWLDGGARAHLRGGVFRGSFRDAIRAQEGSTLEVHKTQFRGPVSAIRAIGSTTLVKGVSIEGGRGVAISSNGGTMRLEEVRVTGHEYGVLGGEGQLTIDGLTSIGAELAGIGLVKTRAELNEVTVIDAGNLGGVQCAACDLRLQQFVIAGSKSFGVSLSDARAEISDGVILRIKDPEGALGDGVHARRTKLRLSSVSMRRLAGSGILAAEGARVAARDLVIEEAGWGGVIAETGATVEAVSLLVRGSRTSAVAVPTDGTVRVDLLVSANNDQGPAWAECGEGASIALGRIQSDLSVQLTSSCISAWTDVTLFDPFAEEGPRTKR